jgi:hypothetical protein
MAASAGLPDRILQICQGNLYPPVRPEMSRVLENPHLPGHILAVLRIHESPEAPHTVNNGRRVYERVKSQNDWCDFATLDRIRHLLERRSRWEADREAFITENLARAMRRLQEPRHELANMAGINPHNVLPPTRPCHLPLRWACVSPLYPWRPLCEPQECFRRLRASQELVQPQRLPGGAFALTASYDYQKHYITGCSSLDSKGRYFTLEMATEAAFESGLKKSFEQAGTTAMHALLYERCQSLLHKALTEAKAFYAAAEVEKPGLLLLSFGVEDAMGFQMVVVVGQDFRQGVP